jgi:hypothetical protein
LKNALLCRILVYAVVLGGFIAPIVIVASLSFVHESIKVAVGIACMVALLIYIFINFGVLMALDTVLAELHCRNTARKRFVLSRKFSVERVEKRIARFGKEYPPTAFSPRPHMLKYKSCFPLTIYSSGIEKIILTYHVDILDKEQYHTIINSASSNSLSLKGKVKHRFLDRNQKEAPINQVTVIFIFAKRVVASLQSILFKTVCKNGGNGETLATIPCVVDLDSGYATFDSVREPYIGFIYPAKNRGIRLIKRFLFNKKLPLSASPDRLEPLEIADVEQSLWSLWRHTRKSLVIEIRESKRRFEKMRHGDIVFEDGEIYIKYTNSGACIAVELDEQAKVAHIEAFDSWFYPKSNKISKDAKRYMKKVVDIYFAELGYSTKYEENDNFYFH